MRVYAMVHMWILKDNFWEMILSLPHPLSYFTGPQSSHELYVQSGLGTVSLLLPQPPK